MHYALQTLAAEHAVVLAAFDVNHAANAVYEHNFGQTPRQVGEMATSTPQAASTRSRHPPLPVWALAAAADCPSAALPEVRSFSCVCAWALLSLRVQQVDLAAVTAAELDGYAADLWLMAPPCQPFTRQGKQLGAADSRSSSFLHLLAQLQLMRVQPQGLLVENVVGFQGSDVHTQLAAALAQCGYDMQVC